MDKQTADGHYTVFANRMGMQPGADIAIPFLGVDFNRWAPVMVLLVVWLTVVNAFGEICFLSMYDAFAYNRFEHIAMAWFSVAEVGLFYPYHV